MLGQRFQSMLLDDREEFERRPTRPLCSGLPLLNSGFACVKVTCEDWLAHTKALP